jgi:hypothetical protein
VVSEPVDLAFAGLLFEYVDIGAVMLRIRSLLRPDGVLTVVLQLPGEVAEVTPSPYAALRALRPVMRLVPPREMEKWALAFRLRPLDAGTTRAAGAKRFHVREFLRPVTARDSPR